MEDIGMSPDYRSMSPEQRDYEIIVGYELECPWCEADLNILQIDVGELLELALDKKVETQFCWNCHTELQIVYSTAESGEPLSPYVKVEITATKRVA